MSCFHVGFTQRPDDFKSTLFVARITDWNENMKMPKGSVLLNVSIFVAVIVMK